jgi:hypothetical protein
MERQIGPAASLLSIAGFDVSIVSTLSTFKDLNCTFDERIGLLSAKVSITSSILTQLANVVQQYENEFHLIDNNFQKVKQIRGKDFEALLIALPIVKLDGTGAAHAKPTQPFIIPLDKKSFGWEKLKWAMGGARQVSNLMASLESKLNLQLLLESINLFILRKLDRR